MPSVSPEIAMTPRIAKMSLLARNVPLLVLVCACLWGCDHGDGLTVGTPAMQKACSAYTDIYHLRQANCYGVTSPPDLATVKSRQSEACVLNSSAPGSATDASYWSRCAAAANNNCRGYSCTYPPGMRQAGQPCLASVQCASLYCQGVSVLDPGGAVLPNAIQCGNCVDRLPDGSPCDLATDTCAVESSCFQGVCRKQGQEGASCKFWRDCARPYLTCRGSGTCGQFVGQGQTCIVHSDCLDSQACDPGAKVCVPVKLGQPGAACNGIVNQCETGLCNKVTGTCPTILPDGAACDPNSAAEVCALYARCFQGICQIPNPADCG
jgi:hypothetical protein